MILHFSNKEIKSIIIIFFEILRYFLFLTPFILGEKKIINILKFNIQLKIIINWNHFTTLKNIPYQALCAGETVT